MTEKMMTDQLEAPEALTSSCVYLSKYMQFTLILEKL